MSEETDRMLRNVRDYCYTIEVRAQWAKADIEAVAARPDWKTAAEDDLLACMDYLADARAALLAAHKILQAKPVEKV